MPTSSVYDQDFTVNWGNGLSYNIFQPYIDQLNVQIANTFNANKNNAFTEYTTLAVPIPLKIPSINCCQTISTFGLQANNININNLVNCCNVNTSNLTANPALCPTPASTTGS